MKILKYFLILSLFFLSCSQWSVSSLGQRQFALIKNGDALGQVMIKTDLNGLEKLSTHIRIYDNVIIVADNVLKRVQVMDSDCDVDLVIGSVADIKSDDVNIIPFKFDNIGSIAMDRDQNLYIQNRLTQQKVKRQIDFSPSYILVFNEDGELQHTLGQKGTPDIPFYHIENLEIDSEGRLFVITHSFDSWSVFQFTGKTRNFYGDLEKLQFIDHEENDKYEGKIENVKMYQSGEKFLISVAFYHNLRLKYRKVYDYSIAENKIGKSLMNIPDPRNVLFNIMNDSQVYFWNVDEDDVRFMITTLDGSVIKNIKLDVDYSKSYYTRVINDNSGTIYSYNINRKGIEILQWE